MVQRADYNGLVQIGSGATMTIASGLEVPAAIKLDKIPEFTVDDQGKRYSFDI